MQNLLGDYFLIDSENLEQVKSGLFGYLINDNGIFVGEHVSSIKVGDSNKSLDGAWICIEKKENEIKIHQDAIGTFGLYVYQTPNKFCISNSLGYLIENLSKKETLTINLKFNKALLDSSFCSHTYGDTPVKEIRLIPRNSYITIDIKSKKLSIINIRQREQLVETGALESLYLLDQWFNKWVCLIRKIYTCSKNIVVDLTGGFDSRLTFMFFIKSGINLNEITVSTYDPKGKDFHTYKEDYEIASSIADKFSFKLNKINKSTKQTKKISNMDSVNDSFYAKSGHHKWMNYRNYFEVNNVMYFTGYGGENIRDYWNIPIKNFLQQQQGPYFPQENLSLVESSLTKIAAEYHLQKNNESWFPHLLYRETRCRYHFGKMMIHNYQYGVVTLAPLLDPILERFSLKSKFSNDPNFLIALIFDRFAPELLKFPFDSKRTINKNTLKIAHLINQMSPYTPLDEKEIAKKSNFFISVKTRFIQENIKDDMDLDNFLEKIIRSSFCKNMICNKYSCKVYQKAEKEEKGPHCLMTNAVIQLSYLHGLIEQKPKDIQPGCFYSNILKMIGDYDQ